ncbi:sialidase-3-like [Tiliqua scincoides]|uniref:sialidase-3-like n=1 Tax=Tiliqua scincoides TaxID=71010 RepID=UPI0034629934
MAGADVGSGKVALFCQGKGGGCVYRIPALLYLPLESTFLAFAEERSSVKDEDAKFLVMRRGLKKGMTVEWGPQEALMSAMLPKHRTMNPCPVYQEKSGTIFLFFICVLDHITNCHQKETLGRNAVRLCYVCSQDAGRTWSQALDLTEELMGADLRNWATFAVGPGHGLQLHSGRLVIPAYAFYTRRRCFHCFSPSCTKASCFTFFSDDDGQNWSRGHLLESFQTTECQVAELTHQDDSCVLYLNARNLGNSGWDHCRVCAFSKDCGVQFKQPFRCRELYESPHGCQGSVVSFSPIQEFTGKEDTRERTHLLGTQPSSLPHKDSKSWLIFSHPTSRHKREDLGIYLNTSPLDQGPWKAPWVIHKGPSGYSDLAVCEEEKSLLFGCLFECGVSSPYEEIAFQLFSDVELMRNVREH